MSTASRAAFATRRSGFTGTRFAWMAKEYPPRSTAASAGRRWSVAEHRGEQDVVILPLFRTVWGDLERKHGKKCGERRTFPTEVGQRKLVHGLFGRL